MGLFAGKKKTSDDDAAAIERRFMDANFREELRNHARLYFEKVVDENGTLFKSDLDATVTQLNADVKDNITGQVDAAIAEIKTELKGHVKQQLDTQFAEHATSMKEAQETALQAMTQSAQTIQAQHQQLATALQQSLTEQETTLAAAFEDSKVQISKMKDTQALTLQWLASSVQALQQQHEQLEQMIQQNVVAQEDRIVSLFEQNMAAIVEHYLLGALGDQYDLKAQLPSIIKQMEANKQAIVDDMKL
ncbi:hypothetical protein EYC58_02360 [Candidatus Saccharibacteria bacterium]|nr:MAG: hypothetical protein EYC58_02360 [Candidatus Saccharibacteria bacterium]